MIVIKRTDGGVSLSPGTFDEAAEAAIVEKWKALRPDLGVMAHHQLPDDMRPADEIFRNAWEDTGTAIVVNMAKARELKREQLRALRDPLLVQADVDYLKADETNDLAKKLEIVARKKLLRDVTNDPAIEAAQTPEALKAVMPAILLP